MPLKTNETKSWKIVKFTTDKEDLVRALPESWILTEPLRQSNGDTKTKYSCYWPKFTFEFELTNFVTKCAPPKSTWDRYEAIICANAGKK